MKVRISTMIVLAVAAGCGFTLFQTSQNVQQAESRYRGIESGLNKEKEAIRVLEAEWDYLNRPDRIEALVKGHLDMAVPQPRALVRDSGDVPDNATPIPARKPSQIMKNAVVKAESTKAPGANLPMPAPVTNSNTHERFDSLLNDIIKQEPASGGTP